MFRYMFVMQKYLSVDCSRCVKMLIREIGAGDGEFQRLSFFKGT